MRRRADWTRRRAQPKRAGVLTGRPPPQAATVAPRTGWSADADGVARRLPEQQTAFAPPRDGLPPGTTGCHTGPMRDPSGASVGLPRLASLVRRASSATRHLHHFRWRSPDPFSGSSLYACRCGEVRPGL
ncbi:protein of unknown function [Blastococcus saxobsidens DD2]|uniref:Uncharacterized protein n=1 Tax=Blastococcus saxobsidens (strain DD2) TaxID=1146883 RepID=H6RN13_BLASD|nr:protein of unknown function [Blastococcus saxobsidens DD2]